jgi:hypothetical protein
MNRAGTATCQIIQTRIGRTNVSLVDCPGFNDTNRSDTEVLAEIAKVLSAQYLLANKLHLRGILYLRDITKTRMEGSDVRTLKLFSRLVGPSAFPHVVFVTTMWGRLDAEGQRVAYKREKELKDHFWKEMILEGSYVTAFQGSKASAEGIVAQLIGDANPVILQIQHELIDQDMALESTAAGAILAPVVEERLVESKSRLRRFRARLVGESNSTIKTTVLLDIERAERERDQAQLDKDQLKKKIGSELKPKIKEPANWQESIRTICTTVGVSLQVIVSVILPAAGVSCTIM